MLEKSVTKVLELGCGVRPTPGALHHDRIAHSAHVDVAHDLDTLPWPWPDGSFDEIIAFDVLEHLKLEVAQWLDEAWRILCPGGQLRLRLPAFDNPVSFRDPTHQRLFHEETFYYWQPGHPLHENYGRFYFAESGRWWDVTHVARVNPDSRYGIGDLAVELRKRGAAFPPDVPVNEPGPVGSPRSPGLQTGGRLANSSDVWAIAQEQADWSQYVPVPNGLQTA